jgi:hypothetical protein
MAARERLKAFSSCMYGWDDSTNRFYGKLAYVSTLFACPRYLTFLTFYNVALKKFKSLELWKMRPKRLRGGELHPIRTYADFKCRQLFQ